VVNDCGAVALGRSLFPTVAEDKFDRGPLSRGPFSLVADIRLDNRPELVRGLDLSSEQAAPMSDSALLFEALLTWGEKSLDRLVGEYAFALWNDDRQELLLGRDILGLRPLHYYEHQGFLAFSSMPSGLHALHEVPYDLDIDFMIERLAIVPQVGSETYFKDIRRVEPAHIVRVSRTGVRARRYWHPVRPVANARPPKEYEEGLRSVVEEAVKSHLRGVGNVVASQLSSGLDSSTVTATAARLFAEGTVAAYTAVPNSGFSGVVPPKSTADESAYAAATARLYPNIEHIVIPNSGESPLRWLDRSFFYQQQPMANLANAVWGQAIHRAAKERGANTILKASAGNLTASYSGAELLALLLSQGRLLKVAQASSALIRNGMSPLTVANHLLGPFTPRFLWNSVRRMTGRTAGIISFAAFNRAQLEQVEEKSAERGWDLAERPRRDPFESRVWALRRADGGNAYKGVLAEWGLSVRDPTADRRVIEYCLTVPFEEFSRGGVLRSLARRAFSDRLPGEVAWLRTRGYQSADWYEALNSARSGIEEELSSIFRCAQAGDALDLGWLQECLDNWPTDGWEREDVRSKYRLGLLRGISAGHFMRKVKGIN
jgi:asparagine synthase (glutamine-hydrolysing)